MTEIVVPCFDPVFQAIDKKSESYQTQFEQHQRNGCAFIPDAGVIYDAVKLAQKDHLIEEAIEMNHAENHPAIKLLCQCWNNFKSPVDTIYRARVPVIQWFTGDERYTPICPFMKGDPLKRKPNSLLDSGRKEASLVFDEFLVTYLAGKKHTVIQGYVSDARLYPEEYHYLTVNKKIFYTDREAKGENMFSRGMKQNQFAWTTLASLRLLPKRAPALWKQLESAYKADSLIENNNKKLNEEGGDAIDQFLYGKYACEKEKRSASDGLQYR